VTYAFEFALSNDLEMELCADSGCTYIQMRTHTPVTVCCVTSHEFTLFLMCRGFFIAVCRDIVLSKSVVTRFPAARLNYKILMCSEQRVFLCTRGSFRMFPESLYF
jgi:hypothetical protein